MNTSKAFKQGFMDAMKKMASDEELPEPLIEYALSDVYDKGRNWMSPEDLVDYMSIERMSEPLYEKSNGLLNKAKLLKDLKRGYTADLFNALDSRKVPYKKHKMLFGLLPDSIEEDPLSAVVDDSGTQRLRKEETDFLRDMYTTGEDEDREEVKRLLKSYIFKHDLDDLTNKSKK